MKLKATNAVKKPVNVTKDNSPKKQGKGGVARKEKSKEVVKPAVLKKEGEKTTKVESVPSPQKILQQELWRKAIENVAKMSNLSDEESSIAKLLVDYKIKASIPQKSAKLKNFITKGFSKFKDTNDEVLNGIYEKLSSEFKAVGGVVGGKTKNAENKKSESKPKSKKESDNDDGDDDDDDEEEEEEEEEMVIEDEEDDDDEVDDKTEGIDFDNSEDDSEEEKSKPKAKGNKPNIKNGKSQGSNGKNSAKFKGGKVQKNKKFAKKK